MDNIAITNGCGEGCSSRKPSSTGWVAVQGAEATGATETVCGASGGVD